MVILNPRPNFSTASCHLKKNRIKFDSGHDNKVERSRELVISNITKNIYMVFSMSLKIKKYMIYIRLRKNFLKKINHKTRLKNQ